MMLAHCLLTAHTRGRLRRALVAGGGGEGRAFEEGRWWQQGRKEGPAGSVVRCGGGDGAVD